MRDVECAAAFRQPKLRARQRRRTRCRISALMSRDAKSDSALLRRLTALLPKGRVLAGAAQLAAYESDGLTAFQARPLAVVVPETQDEVIATVRFCHGEKLPFVA